MGLNKKIILCILLALPTFAFGQEDVEQIWPIRMFVSATSGLRAREAPSLDSSVLTVLPYKKVLVLDRRTSNKVTIDGISDYWYSLKYDPGWVFGGFLTDRSESNPVVGFWRTEGFIAEFSFFYFDGTFWSGIDGSGAGGGGTFEFMENGRLVLHWEGWDDETGKAYANTTERRIKMINNDRMVVSEDNREWVLIRDNRDGWL